jgi:hypothetical protein
MPFIADNQNQTSGFIPDKPVEKSIGGFVKNIGESGADLVGSTVGAVLNPIETVKNLISLVKDPMVLVDYYKNRYGKDLLTTLYEDPVGVLGDLSTVIGGAGAVAKVGGLTKVAKVANVASKLTDPLTIASKLPVVKPVISAFKRIPSKAGTIISNTAERYTTAGLGSPKELGNIKKLTGMSQTDFFNKYNLWDKSPETIQAAITKLDDLRTSNVNKAGLTTKTGDVVKAFDNEIAKLQQGVGGVTSETAKTQIKQLNKLKNEFINSIGSQYSNPLKADKKLVIKDGGILEWQTTPVDKYANKKFISSVPINTEVSTLNAFRKNVIDPDIPSSIFGMSTKGSAKASASKVGRDIVRSSIEKVVPGTKQLGREEAGLLKLKKVVEGAENRQSARQPINFTKLGSATAGGIVAGFPGAAAGFLLEKAVNSPKGTSIIAKSLQKTGKAVTNIKTPKIVSKTSKIVKPIGKTGRMINKPYQENSKNTPNPFIKNKVVKGSFY